MLLNMKKATIDLNYSTKLRCNQIRSAFRIRGFFFNFNFFLHCQMFVYNFFKYLPHLTLAANYCTFFSVILLMLKPEHFKQGWVRTKVFWPRPLWARPSPALTHWALGWARTKFIPQGWVWARPGPNPLGQGLSPDLNSFLASNSTFFGLFNVCKSLGA